MIPQSIGKVTPILSVSIDAVADAALQARHEAEEAETLQCDACNEPLEGEPAGRGLFMWTRGDEVRFEEPALCDKCAMAIGITALSIFTVEEEEG